MRSRGPVDILNWVIKTFSDILALPIMDIINTSFRSSKVPDIWKLADSVLLPKVPMVQDLERERRPTSFLNVNSVKDSRKFRD